MDLGGIGRIVAALRDAPLLADAMQCDGGRGGAFLQIDLGHAAERGGDLRQERLPLDARLAGIASRTQIQSGREHDQRGDQ